MIPLKLELKNFLSYGNAVQTVNFDDYHLICFSGKNGHGKSALLDAITWSVWGQARKTSGIAKADTGLIRLGETSMMVSLEFIFSGRRYRVRREFSKTYGRDYSALDFEVFDETAASFKSLTDKTIRDTQKKIETLLGLDYETFINTAFLRQGHSNEFSQKTPKERKAILSSILGFDVYESLREKAQEKARTFLDKKRGLVLVQEKLLKELEAEPETKALLQEVLRQEEQLQKQLKELDVALEDVRLRRAMHQEHLKEQKVLEESLKVSRNNALMARTNFFDCVSRWRGKHAELVDAGVFKAQDSYRMKLQEREAAFRKIHQRYLELQEQLLKEKEKFAHLSEMFKTTQEKKLLVLRAQAESARLDVSKIVLIYGEQYKALVELERVLAEQKKKLGELEEKNLQYASIEHRYQKSSLFFEKRRVFYQVLTQRGNAVFEDLEEMRRKIDVTQDRGNPSCPLCEQVLTAKRKQFLSCKFETERSFLIHRFERIKLILPKLKVLLIEHNKEVLALKSDYEAYQKLRLEYQAAHKAAQELEAKRISLSDILKDIAQKKVGLEKLLAEKDEALRLLLAEFDGIKKQNPELCLIQDAIARIEREQGELAYDKAAHEVLRAELDGLQGRSACLDELSAQNNSQKELMFKAQALRLQVRSYKKECEGLEEKLKECLLRCIQCAPLEARFETYEVQRKDACEKRDCIINRRAGLQADIKRYELARQELKGCEADIAVLDDEMYDYETLAQVMGKNGIQAVLIDQAIPEIEEEANSILSRLTENNAQIFIDSLRDLKKGGVRETLDIKISDTIGIRPYEMFSGGEAFRIDFALRIAISKLLARRAGTALQTLIIDEGFGSQDDEGLGHLMEAIHAIKDDFAKVIVVSHLPVFKENFPVHFLIDKTMSGSTVRVLERG